MKIKDLPKIKRSAEKLEKACTVCGEEIKVILYQDRSYRGGHYFGKMSLPTEQEIEKNISSSGKPVEYWECPKCYWK